MTDVLDEFQVVFAMKDKIRALRAKAASSTFPGEKASFNAAAERLMKTHGLVEKDLHFQPMEIGMLTEGDILWLQEWTITELTAGMTTAGLDVTTLDVEWIRNFTQSYALTISYKTEQEQEEAINEYAVQLSAAYHRDHDQAPAIEEAIEEDPGIIYQRQYQPNLNEDLLAKFFTGAVIGLLGSGAVIAWLIGMGSAVFRGNGANMIILGVIGAVAIIAAIVSAASWIKNECKPKPMPTLRDPLDAELVSHLYRWHGWWSDDPTLISVLRQNHVFFHQGIRECVDGYIVPPLRHNH